MKRSDKNRVLILLPNAVYPNNGHLRQEALALIGAGFRVTLISPRVLGDANHPPREELEGVSVFRYPAPPRKFNFLGYAFGYTYTLVAMFLISFALMLGRGFDILHIYTPPDALGFIAAFYKLLGKRVVYDHRDLAPEMYHAIFGKNNPRVYRALVMLEKLCCRVADRVIAPNESYKLIEMHRGGVPADRIHIVRSGPDLNLIRPVEPDPALRQPGKTMLGYVGSMGLHDGVDHLLRALHHLAYDLQRTDFYCVLVGKGKAFEKMVALSQELRLEPYVNFIGKVKHAEVVTYLSSVDICLAPEPSNSYNDRSTVIKVNEYLALGKPVVSFDLPEHRVTAQKAAVYARATDEADFARKIAWLMDNPQEWPEMSRFGLERARNELSWSHQVKQLLAAYDALRRPRRRFARSQA
ncbi:MAG: glycosyltransferase family 4 protein [Anaerolineales bacterium]|nr:glycosyltransferase family 4 protein [Anaerolineales bacterium]